MINAKGDQLELMQKATNMFRASSDILRNVGEAMMPLQYGNGKFQRIDVGVTISSVVLYAFTCEVGLKTLYYKEQNRDCTGHDLQELFEQLSADAQARIEREVMARNLTGGNDSFATLLNNNRLIFQQWRYFYEYNNKGVPASLGFLKELSEAICREIDRKQA